MKRIIVLLAAAALSACQITGPIEVVGDDDDGSAGVGGAGDGGAQNQGGDDIVGSGGFGEGGEAFGGFGGQGGEGAGTGVGGNGQQPPMSPTYRIPLRIHTGLSGLTQSEVEAVLSEMNWVWWSQAAICFEVEYVTHDDVMSTGYDMWFKTSGNYNGYYNNDHNIYTIDHPSLASSPNPIGLPAARTSAHELGHGLNLGHYNGMSDSSNSLMSSGTKGWALHGFEIDTARQRAAEKALTDTTPLYCAPETM